MKLLALILTLLTFEAQTAGIPSRVPEEIEVIEYQITGDIYKSATSSGKSYGPVLRPHLERIKAAASETMFDSYGAAYSVIQIVQADAGSSYTRQAVTNVFIKQKAIPTELPIYRKNELSIQRVKALNKMLLSTVEEFNAADLDDAQKSDLRKARRSLANKFNRLDIGSDSDTEDAKAAGGAGKE